MRSRIIMAAAEEIKFRGFKFTMSDLVKRINISKSSLYEHFSSKNELVSTLIDMALEDIFKQEEMIYNNFEMSIEQKFQSLIIVSPVLFGPLSDRIYDDLRKVFPEEWKRVEDFRQERLDRMISLLEKGVESHNIQPTNFKVLKQLIIGAMNDLFDYRFLVENNMTYHDAMVALAKIIVSGLTENPKNC